MRASKYIWRPCSQCGEYMEIAVSKLRRTLLADGVIGKCPECGYLLSWLVFVSDLPPRRRRRKPLPLRVFLERMS